jgi:mannose-6-phosphate isomerase-like protein (cupin superfamily)
MKKWAIFVWFLALGCPSGGKFYALDGQFSRKNILKIVAENPIGPTETIKIVNLGATDSSSQHIVQVRTAEPPHIHAEHDATVFLVRGNGEMVLGEHKFPLKSGDVMTIRRGQRHFFVNRGRQSAVAVVVFSPPFDGKDTIPVP